MATLDTWIGPLDLTKATPQELVALAKEKRIGLIYVELIEHGAVQRVNGRGSKVLVEIKPNSEHYIESLRQCLIIHKERKQCPNTQ